MVLLQGRYNCHREGWVRVEAAIVRNMWFPANMSSDARPANVVARGGAGGLGGGGGGGVGGGVGVSEGVGGGGGAAVLQCVVVVLPRA